MKKYGILILTLALAILAGVVFFPKPDKPAYSTARLPQTKVVNMPAEEPQPPVTAEQNESTEKPEPVFDRFPSCSRLSPDDYTLIEKKIKAFYAENLSSENEQSRLTALMMTSFEGEAAMNAWQSFLSEYPRNTDAVRETLRLCSVNGSHSVCNHQLVRQAEEAGRDDGETWLNLVLFHIEQNDHEAVLASLENMVQAKNYSNHYARFVSLALDSVVAEQVASLEGAVIYAMGKWAAGTYKYNLLKTWCGRRADEPAVASACIAAAKDMVARAPLELEKLIGHDIELDIHTKQGNMAMVDAVREEMEADVTPEHPRLADALDLMMHDHALFYTWLNALQQSSEEDAISALIKEAADKSADPSYQPCRTESDPPSASE